MPPKRVRAPTVPTIRPKCIGVVGSRRRADIEDYEQLREKFKEVYKPGDSLVSGGCPTGGDAFAETLAEEVGANITIHKPDWETNGRTAGFMRNTLIASQCDVLIALVASDRTGGTEDTISKARKMGKKVIILEQGVE